MKENLLDLDGGENEYVPTKITTLEIKEIPFERGIQEYLEVSLTPPSPGYLVITGLEWNFLNIPAFLGINYDATD